MFKITIEEIKEVEVPYHPQWGVLGTKVADPPEGERMSRYIKDLDRSVMVNWPTTETRGYLPPPPPGTPPETKEVTKTIYEQLVSELNLGAVISAVNAK